MRLRALLALAPLALLLVGGCGGDDTCLTCDDAGSSVADAADATADATLDGGRRDAGDAGDTGDGSVDGGVLDAGDAAAEAGDLGRPGVALVSGGTVCTSPKYRMVVSLGQGPGGNAVSASPKYRFAGGVVGATQPASP
jgi:hypothetical protein